MTKRLLVFLPFYSRFGKIEKQNKKNMINEIKQAIGYAWEILFANDHGVCMKFIGWLQANPVFLLPIGFYLIYLGIKTIRKLITGY